MAMDGVSCRVLGRIKCEWNLAVTSPGSGFNSAWASCVSLGIPWGTFPLLHESEIVIKRFTISPSFDALEFSGFKISVSFPIQQGKPGPSWTTSRERPVRVQ